MGIMIVILEKGSNLLFYGINQKVVCYHHYTNKNANTKEVFQTFL